LRISALERSAMSEASLAEVSWGMRAARGVTARVEVGSLS
jgi:hypothetical protein